MRRHFFARASFPPQQVPSGRHAMIAHGELRQRLVRYVGTALALAVVVSLPQTAQAKPRDDNPGRGGPHQAPAAAPATAFDYTQVQGLSTDQYATVEETLTLPMYDGTEVYIEVT